MADDSFLTVEAPAEVASRERSSKFLAYIFPVQSEEQIRGHLELLRKRYFDATHHCYAWRLGAQGERWRANDDGEPSGTAGKPILGQINSFGLTDVVIVVVRYFGGIKLGTSGLIAAYREAARMALEEADIEERHVMAQIEFVFPYLAMNDVMKLTKTPGIRIIDQQFDNTCRMTVAIRLDDADMLKKKLSDIDGVSLNE